MITSLPNMLTLGRILVLFPITALFFMDGDEARWWCFAFYTAACITDFFDGYLARMTKQTSALGKFLDPIADKLLIATILFLLVATNRLEGIHVIPGLIILIREITVSGLREFLSEIKVSVPVSNLAKWKTTAQMLSLGFLIVGTASPDFIPSILIGQILIWASAILTTITGYDYLRTGLKYMTK